MHNAVRTGPKRSHREPARRSHNACPGALNPRVEPVKLNLGDTGSNVTVDDLAQQALPQSSGGSSSTGTFLVFAQAPSVSRLLERHPTGAVQHVSATGPPNLRERSRRRFPPKAPIRTPQCPHTQREWIKTLPRGPPKVELHKPDSRHHDDNPTNPTATSPRSLRRGSPPIRKAHRLGR
jgi:hypothetical protein